MSETVTIPRELLERLVDAADFYATVVAQSLVREQWQPIVDDCKAARALLSAPPEPDQLGIARKHRAQDWADDHDHLKALMKKHGFTDERIYPTDYCPTISDLADMLEKRLAGDLERLRAAIREHREAVEFAHLQNAFDWDRRLWAALE